MIKPSLLYDIMNEGTLLLLYITYSVNKMFFNLPTLNVDVTRYGTSTFDYFSRQGIPGPKPLPYVGNMWGVWRVVY